MIRQLSALGLAAILLSGCERGETGSVEEAEFAALQERGGMAMGVDQYTSSHLFDSLPNGGRIELQRDSEDAAGTAEIRRHLQDVSESFAAGNFDIPGFVHGQDVPGTDVMAARRDYIEYRYSDLPRGGELSIVTADEQALAAIHEFVAFQRMDHRAGGVSHQH